MFSRRSVGLSALLLVCSVSVRCVSESPGVLVELFFDGSPSSVAAGSTAPRAASAKINLTELELLPCESTVASAVSWLGPSTARAHDGATPRAWTGSERIDALAPGPVPLALLSPAATSYCGLRVTVAPNENGAVDPRLDPMDGLALLVEVTYLDDGEDRRFVLSSSATRDVSLALDPPIVLDAAEDVFAVSLSLDVAGWMADLDPDVAQSAAYRVRLGDELASHLRVDVSRSVP